MTPNKNRLFMSLLFVLLLALAACGGTPEAPAPAEEAPAAAEEEMAEEEMEEESMEEEMDEDADGDMAEEAMGDVVELRMTWYTDGTEDVAMRAILDQFEAENPDIKVVLDNVAYTSILENLPIQLAAGEGPDLARVTNLGGLSEFYLDISPYVDTAYWEDSFGPFLNWVRPAGDTSGIYGMMTQLTVTGPYINRTLFDQAGVEVPTGDATWEEWAALSREVAEATGTDFALAMDRTGHRLAGPAISQGAAYFDADGHPAIDDDGFRAMAQLMADWHADGTMPLDVWAASAPANELFVNGQLVMYMSGSWQIGQFAETIGDGFDWQVVPNPCGPAACSGMPGGAALVPIKTTEHPEEVARVMDYIAQEEVLRQFSADTLFIPGHLGLSESGVEYNTDLESAANALSTFVGQVGKLDQTAFDLQAYPFNFSIFNATRDRLVQVILGEMELDDAISRMQEDVDAELAEAMGETMEEEAVMAEPLDEPVELRMTWYTDGNEDVVMRDLLDRFEEENPGLTVVLDNIAYTSILENLPIQLAAGEGPDLARVTNLGGLSEFYLDLSPYVDTAYWESNFGPFLNWVRPAGDTEGIYGMMTQLTVTGPYINKTLFDQAGVEVPTGDTTWEEWAALSREVAEATGTDYALAMDRTGHRLAGPAISQGAAYFDADGNPAIDDEGFRAMAQLMVDWHADGTMPADVWAAGAAPNELFVNGQLVMYMSGSWQIGQFAETIGDAFDWQVVPNPCGPGACSGMPGGAALVPIKTTEHPEHVATLMEFLAQEDVLEEFSARSLFIPGHLGLSQSGVAYETDVESAANALSTFVGQVGTLDQTAFDLQAYPVNFAIFNAVRDRLVQVILDELTLDEAIVKMQEDVDQAVAEAGS